MLGKTFDVVPMFISETSKLPNFFCNVVGEADRVECSHIAHPCCIRVPTSLAKVFEEKISNSIGENISISKRRNCGPLQHVERATVGVTVDAFVDRCRPGSEPISMWSCRLDRVRLRTVEVE